jgi:hypothetical protein
MNYTEQLKKRAEYLEKADDLIEIYTRIADELYRKHISKYSSTTRIDIDESGITYEYYVDNWDYSAGRDTFFVSVKTLEENIEKYLRKEKLKKIKEVTND